MINLGGGGYLKKQANIGLFLLVWVSLFKVTNYMLVFIENTILVKYASYFQLLDVHTTPFTLVTVAHYIYFVAPK
jgi:hypothetical protein